MPSSKLFLWAGRVFTVLPALLLTFSASMKLIGGPEFEKSFAQFGWSIEQAAPLGVVELAVTILFLIPRTSVLGAILITGYLGGAVATHARIHDAWQIAFLLGVLPWAALYCRDARIRALIPIYTKPQ